MHLWSHVGAGLANFNPQEGSIIHKDLPECCTCVCVCISLCVCVCIYIYILRRGIELTRTLLMFVGRAS